MIMTFFTIRFYNSKKVKEGKYNFFHLSNANEFFDKKGKEKGAEVEIYSESNKKITCKDGSFITFNKEIMPFQDETSVNL